jgi:PPM family protein phosphatase
LGSIIAKCQSFGKISQFRSIVEIIPDSVTSSVTYMFRKWANRKKTVMNDQPVSKSDKTQPIPVKTEKYLVDSMVTAFAQSSGKQRDHNEDSLFMAASTFTNQQQKYPFGIFIVADGMGGHSNGEVASGIAAKAIGRHIMTNVFPLFIDQFSSINEETLQDIVQSAVKEAHLLINQNAPGGGTTLTAVLVFGVQMMIIHVGDSRAYHISEDGSIQVLTRDHSFVRKLVELGQITQEEAALHPQRNVLYRALGQSDTYDVDLSTLPLPDHGHLLICSDGLWGVISETALVQITNSSDQPSLAAQRLVDAANAAGGPDNISAILVRLQK